MSKYESRKVNFIKFIRRNNKVSEILITKSPTYYNLVHHVKIK